MNACFEEAIYVGRGFISMVALALFPAAWPNTEHVPLYKVHIHAPNMHCIYIEDQSIFVWGNKRCISIFLFSCRMSRIVYTYGHWTLGQPCLYTKREMVGSRKVI
jgi:hypothetical protein